MYKEATFLKELDEQKNLIETAMKGFLPSEDTFPPIIHQAMHYAIYNGGKRLRPILVLQGAKLAGGNVDDVMAAACAIEMIHAYSLVHDDLPAMDNDDFRRGQPTCHRVYGEANAILTGDALLTEAFAVFCQANAPGENIVRALREMAVAVGSQGMVGGQVLDLAYEGKNISYDDLYRMQQLKTSQLFRASLRVGAILCNMNAKGLEALTRYADEFGFAFQITDDILDISGDVDHLGKPIGSDERNKKTTYVSLFGMEKAQKRVHQSIEECWDALKDFGAEADFLRQLAFYLIKRQS
ncbi:MAG TPA: polyprenyl synthetase family protein [Syntrophomonadaceae bacterium]|jgi:geranylgeranyl diphosphate synthase type II|nr:polyprenyl synthetase family protein [Syntrophomonadaceae bacterium]